MLVSILTDDKLKGKWQLGSSEQADDRVGREDWVCEQHRIAKCLAYSEYEVLKDEKPISPDARLLRRLKRSAVLHSKSAINNFN